MFSHLSDFLNCSLFAVKLIASYLGKFAWITENRLKVNENRLKIIPTSRDDMSSSKGHLQGHPTLHGSQYNLWGQGWHYVVLDVIPEVRDDLMWSLMSSLRLGMILCGPQCCSWGQGWPCVVLDVIPEVRDGLMWSLMSLLRLKMTLCHARCHPQWWGLTYVFPDVMPMVIPDVIPKVGDDLMWSLISSLSLGMILCGPWCCPRYHPQCHFYQVSWDLVSSTCCPHVIPTSSAQDFSSKNFLNHLKSIAVYNSSAKKKEF